MARKYFDFSLGFESTPGGGYLVRAASRQAEAESITELTFDSGELEVLRPLVRGSDSTPCINGNHESLGRALFAALFPGPVGELYSAESRAASEAGSGLRIRLHFRPQNPELAWLTRVPWELLFDDINGGFPALNPSTPILRHLDLPRPASRVPFESPIRILVAMADTIGPIQLQLEDELKRIETALAGRKRFEVEVIGRASPEILRQKLTRSKYQIVHFMGHGLSNSGEGSLIFATARGQARPVAGKELAHLLQTKNTPRLVILSACRSAATPKDHRADPLAGVAGALVRNGQPAVIGMQFDVNDSAAITFSGRLYEQLAEGEPIEAAVSEARLAVYLANSNSTNWVAPVLFLRGADQRLEGNLVKSKNSAGDSIHFTVESSEAKGRDIKILGSTGDQSSRRPRKIRANISIKKIIAHEGLTIAAEEK